MPRRLHAGVDGQQPRRPALPDPLGRRRPGPRPVRADDAADAARQRVPLRGRRDRHARHDVPRKTQLVDPVGIRTSPRTRPRPGARRRCSGTTSPGGGFTDAGVEPWLPFGDVAVQRRGPARRPGLVPLADPRPHRVCATRSPTCAPARTQRSTRPTGVLAYRRGERTLVALNLGDAAGDGRRRRRRRPRRHRRRPRRRARRRLAHPRARRRRRRPASTSLQPG